MNLNLDDKIYIAGHRGMVGSSICKKLGQNGYKNLVFASRKELDLTDKIAVSEFFKKESPDVVILAAAKVGGIQANIDEPFEFLYENLEIQNNVISAASEMGVSKFCFLGSSCIYPKESPQPIKEDYLLKGPLEPTNEGYALAKIAGLKLIQYLRSSKGFNGLSIMPCNLYGPNDSFDPHKSHVLSAMVRRIVDAKKNNLDSITVWGTGIARREFMHVEDLADAVVFLLQNESTPDLINVGTGKDISIKELAELISEIVEFDGDILWDNTKPDGMLRKCLDVSVLKSLGFKEKISLKQGISEMISIYKNEYQD